MKIKISIALAVLLLSFSQTKAQSFSLSAVLGAGNIKSNSPSETTMDIKLQARGNLKSLPYMQFGVSYFYSRKLEFYLPENRTGRYYPYFQGVVVFAESFNNDEIMTFCYKGGVVFLNDKMFSDRDDWTVGVNAGLGIVFYRSHDGLSLGAEGDYILAFNQNSPSYLSLGLVLGYNFQ